VNYNRNLVFAGPAPQSGDCCTGWNRTRDMETDSYGVFVQAHYDFTEKLNATLGARYSYDKKSIETSRTDRPTAAPGRLLKASDHWADTDYRATLQYDFTPDLMAYGTIATGYKSGGLNDSPDTSAALNAGITPYDPEHVTSYESVSSRNGWTIACAST
jgi:iron complex outermembrane receptor protein